MKWFQTKAQTMEQVKLPQHQLLVATLLYRSQLERLAFAGVLLILAGFAGFLGLQNRHLQHELDHPDAYFVPTHITDILKIRANAVSDTLVFEFAESFVRDLTNLNYQDAPSRLKDLARYMHPSLRADFQRSIRPHIKLWQTKKIDQIFSFEKISGFERKSESFQGKDRVIFTVPIWGEVRKYVDGRPVPSYRELITLKLATSHVTSDRSWVFEVLSLERQTAQEIEDQKFAGKKESSNG